MFIQCPIDQLFEVGERKTFEVIQIKRGRESEIDLRDESIEHQCVLIIIQTTSDLTLRTKGLRVKISSSHMHKIFQQSVDTV